jgi:hypothetical protein
VSYDVRFHGRVAVAGHAKLAPCPLSCYAVIVAASPADAAWRACRLRSSLRAYPGLAGRGHGEGSLRARAGPIKLASRPPPTSLTPALAGDRQRHSLAPGWASSRSCCLADGAADVAVEHGIGHVSEQDPGGGSSRCSAPSRDVHVQRGNCRQIHWSQYQDRDGA